jgi:hypothetical protein
VASHDELYISRNSRQVAGLCTVHSLSLLAPPTGERSNWLCFYRSLKRATKSHFHYTILRLHQYEHPILYPVC